MLDMLNSDRFCENAPPQVWGELIDEGTYLCSIRTMYRILKDHNQTGERRRQAAHPPRVRPELIAKEPNRVWSWDITFLAGPKKGYYFKLYKVMDIYSRKVVAWRVEYVEDSNLVKAMMANAVKVEDIDPSTLTIHSDRGASMTSKTVADLYAELGVTRSLSRPKTSNDNPYSESLFKTLKYCPAYPGKFDCIEDARAWCTIFFNYYNNQHRHGALALHTPASVHDGTATDIRIKRQQVLDAAYQARPLRFRNQRPTAKPLPTVAWINQPEREVVHNK